MLEVKMTEFEEWFWNRYEADYGDYSADAHNVALAGWKAALKWVLTQFEENYDDFYDTREPVREELEQLNQGNSQSNNSPQSNSPG